MRASISLVIIFLIQSCAINIPIADIEKKVELADVYDQDIGSQLIRSVDTIYLKGRTLKDVDNDFKVVLSDTLSNDRIAIKFELGTKIEYELKLTTKQVNNIIHPEIHELKFNSSVPIKFSFNKKKIGSISGINAVGNEKIRADLKSLSIANIIIVLFDNYLFSKNSPVFNLNNFESKFPNLLVDRLQLSFNQVNLDQGLYTMKISKPFKIEATNFELNDNLKLINISDFDIPLEGMLLNSSDIDLEVGKGLFNRRCCMNRPERL